MADNTPVYKANSAAAAQNLAAPEENAREKLTSSATARSDIRKSMEWLDPASEPVETPASELYRTRTIVREQDGKLWPIEAKVRDNPEGALLVALAAGFLTGTLLRRS